MNSTQKIALSLGLGVTAMIPLTATAFAATDASTTSTVADNMMGRGGKGAGRGMMMRAQPLENFTNRLSGVDFTAAGVTQPTWWGDLTTWTASADAKKVAAWMLTQRPAQGTQKPATPPGPGGMLEKVDFTAAGVTKPAFWDNLLTWVKSDDAKKVFETQMQARRGERFTRLADEFGTADFAAAGITKPAFWGDMMTWMKSPDAGKLAGSLFKERGPRAVGSTATQN